MADGYEKSSDESSTVHVDFTSVTGAINSIRKKNIRPDVTSIYQYLRKQGLACEETEVSNTVKTLIEDGLIENKPYRGEDSFYVSAKPNIGSVLKSPLDLGKLKPDECKNKDCFHDEIRKIWLVLDVLCREGRGTHRSANESLLEKGICHLENQIKILESSNKSLSAVNEMLQLELNGVAFHRGDIFNKKSLNDHFVPTNPCQRNTPDYSLLHGSRAAATAGSGATTRSDIPRATQQAKLDIRIPQRPNAITLHNRYSILSDSDFDERKEDHNSNNESNVENPAPNNSSTDHQQLQTRKTVKDQNKTAIKSKQSNNSRNERGSVLILGDSIPKHVDGRKMH